MVGAGTAVALAEAVGAIAADGGSASGHRGRFSRRVNAITGTVGVVVVVAQGDGLRGRRLSWGRSRRGGGCGLGLYRGKARGRDGARYEENKRQKAQKLFHAGIVSPQHSVGKGNRLRG
jgi:hypothetical protein